MALRKDGRLAILVGDIRANGSFHSNSMMLESRLQVQTPGFVRYACGTSASKSKSTLHYREHIRATIYDHKTEYDSAAAVNTGLRIMSRS